MRDRVSSDIPPPRKFVQLSEDEVEDDLSKHQSPVPSKSVDLEDTVVDFGHIKNPETCEYDLLKESFTVLTGKQ